MARSNAIPFLIGAGITFFVISQAQAGLFVQALKVGVSGIRVIKKGTDIFKTKMEIDLALVNSSKVPGIFTQTNGKVIYKNDVISTWFTRPTTPVLIAGNDTTILQIPFTISNLSALDSILDVFLKKTDELNVRILGSLTVNGAKLAFDEVIPMSLTKS